MGDELLISRSCRYGRALVGQVVPPLRHIPAVAGHIGVVVVGGIDPAMKTLAESRQKKKKTTRAVLAVGELRCRLASVAAQRLKGL